jgi:hypothetical protein
MSPSAAVASNVRSSITVTNPTAASGGDDAPSASQLIALIPSTRNMQERIVTKDDLLTRIYTLPTNFGRVYRAAVYQNPIDQLSALLYIISRASDGTLLMCPDALKNNLITYLNQYRVTSDAFDILDVRIINLKLTFEVVIDPTMNKNSVLQNVLIDLQNFLSTDNYSIDQPISIDDVNSLIYSERGVMSINSILFENVSNTVGGRQYSNQTFDVISNTIKNFVTPPQGGMFEFKYPAFDIVGKGI